MSFNWKWPQTKYNDKAPWYTIIRRGIFMPLAMLFVVLLVGTVYIGWGKDTALGIWSDLV
jgi:hypothetical protein